MQESSSVPPSLASYPLHAAIASVLMPLLVAVIAFGPWNLKPHERQALLYGALIMIPFFVAVVPPVALALFLAAWGMSWWLRRPWVAYPLAFVALPLGYLVLQLFAGKR